MTVASFVFSAVALALSGAAFGWQVLAWFLTGGRANVDLRIGVIDKLSQRFFTLPLGPKAIDGIKRTATQNGINGPVAFFVTVSNVGRTALTVKDIAFRAPTNERYGILGGGDWGDKLPKRLEPGDSTTCVYDLSFLQNMAALQCHKHKLSLAPMFAEAELGTGKTVRCKKQALVTPVIEQSSSNKDEMENE
ncbi:hypothetical protein [Actinokineospora sp. NBRC 105648]|uniref:hypothetical protein n=1 Tax=Actinokineospora sp. NBRC 105648 TaxID=3032206 RepID=UPI0024A43EC9|nr:hypothetical protein [Actinokineospora sp. NBRC 105648]GLZ37900.1 hypothetical protein Acsp05_15240 [Actinokineospora sp. NBRC 105648]